MDAARQPEGERGQAERSSTTAGPTTSVESRSTLAARQAMVRNNMRCFTCAGRGWVLNESSTSLLLPVVPCPRCAGSGRDHCCEGSDASCEVIVLEPRQTPSQSPALSHLP